MIWIIRDKNLEATKYYLDILEYSALEANQQVEQVDSVDCIQNDKNDDIYLVTTLIDALKVLIKGKKRLFIWFQGVFAEESYMKYKSKFRKFVLDLIERYVLKKAEFIFFVSDEMKRYYSQKFTIDLDDKCYVMPCFNANINKEAFMVKGKYENNIFCYAGSLSVWQGFDKILKIYKEVEGLELPDTKLLILTSQKDEAYKLVEQTGIKNYIIDYVPLDQISEALGPAKFGFILREDVIVNRVATPTKISTYMANGLIPIFSECLADFNEVSKNMNYIIPYNNDTFLDTIKDFAYMNIEPDEIYNDYLKVFQKYYNKEYHIKQISNIFRNLQ